MKLGMLIYKETKCCPFIVRTINGFSSHMFHISEDVLFKGLISLPSLMVWIRLKVDTTDNMTSGNSNGMCSPSKLNQDRQIQRKVVA